MTTFHNILNPGEIDNFGERQKQPVYAVPTPFPAWNKECRFDGGGQGLAFGWHIIVGGGSNMGKTFLALNLMLSAALNGHTIGLFSQEMTVAAIQQRFYAMLTGLDHENFERGRLNEDALAIVKDRVAELPVPGKWEPLLLVNAKPMRDIVDLWSEAKTMVEQGVRFIVVDYLQLVSGVEEDDIRKEIMRISQALTDLAHEHEALTIGVSQLNREGTKQRKIAPIIENLIGSSALENDADQVVLLDHSRYSTDLERPWLHRTFAKLAKNRHGVRVDLPIEWNFRNFRAREAQPDELGLWPK